MKAKYRIKNRSLFYSILSGLTAAGMLYPAKFTPIRYAHSQSDDLKVIGSDMYKSFRRVANEKKKQTEAA